MKTTRTYTFEKFDDMIQTIQEMEGAYWCTKQIIEYGYRLIVIFEKDMG